MEGKLTNQEEQLKVLSEELALDIDTSELWQNVEVQLPPVKKKRRRPIFWWVLIGLLLMVIGFLVWNNNSDKAQPSSIADSIVNMIEVEAKKPNEVVNEMSNSLNRSKESTPLIASNVLGSSPQNSSNSVQSTFENKKINTLNSSNINYERYDEKPTHSRLEVVNQRLSVNKKMESTLVNPSSSDDYDLLPDNANEERAIIVNEYINTLGIKPLYIDGYLGMPNMQIIPSSTTLWLPYLAVSSGFNIHSDRLYSNSNEALNLLQFENEKPLAGLSSTLRFGFEKSTGWRVTFGIGHNRLVNSYTFKETLISTNEFNGVESRKIDGAGNITLIEGLISETTITNYDIKWHRRHDFINVQIGVGKRLIQKGRFSFYTDAKVMKNIWSHHSGYYFTEGSPLVTKFTNEENNPYKNAGFDLGLSLDLEYRINKLSLTVTPFLSMGLNSIMQDSYYYQLKNSQYGVQLGIVYRP